MATNYSLSARTECAASFATAALRLAMVTNIPAPYRVPVYNRIAREPGIEFHGFYAARTETDRRWDLPPFAHAHTFLPGTVIRISGRFIHCNPAVWRALDAFNPNVVVTTGYNPTHLMAWCYALWKRKRHVVMTDGTDLSERNYSLAHRVVRKAVFAGSQAFVVAAEGGWRLLDSYGIAMRRVHSSPLSANASVDWNVASGQPRDLDVLFSGRLVEIKNANFALQVAAGAARRLRRRMRMAILGEGPEDARLRTLAASMLSDVDVEFAGNVSQADMPTWFQRARIFLFPTLWDPWGVVANEACLSRVPVLVSPHAGVANELVIDGVNGRVLPLELDRWIDATVMLLSDPSLHERMANAARAAVAQYNVDNAALGIIDAARQAADGAAQHRASTFKRPTSNREAFRQ